MAFSGNADNGPRKELNKFDCAMMFWILRGLDLPKIKGQNQGIFNIKATYYVM